MIVAMNNHYTEIAFILDRSGSMGSCREAAIQGFNRFLQEQQQLEGLARLTLVLFDDKYLTAINALPVAEVLPLDHKTYLPRGTTALLDAIGHTVDQLEARLTGMPEKVRPGQVIIAILTDGLENASRQYTWRQIADRIKQQTERYGWTFLFLGANQDAIATAAQMNIAMNNAALYIADAPGTLASHAALSRKARAIRRAAQRLATTQEIHDAAAPMSALIDEEDQKRRS
ncbi:MAG TPA: vWA domain-containing protein [Bryobacteraceae bacterium]|jgi:uncharacterized protein YegL|nr:vWA domain-containing protein [Bryobacteraceae bacterium]